MGCVVWFQAVPVAPRRRDAVPCWRCEWQMTSAGVSWLEVAPSLELCELVSLARQLFAQEPSQGVFMIPLPGLG